jgi:hypothetical protein
MLGTPKSPLQSDLNRYAALSEGQVVPEAMRCVQCGICSYNCPINIDVRAHAWQLAHSRCAASPAGSAARCPRGVLRRSHGYPLTTTIVGLHCRQSAAGVRERDAAATVRLSGRRLRVYSRPAWRIHCAATCRKRLVAHADDYAAERADHCGARRTGAPIGIK